MRRILTIVTLVTLVLGLAAPELAFAAPDGDILPELGEAVDDAVAGGNSAQGEVATSVRLIVMLTALGDVADRITGLELGADDYVVKPFSPKELEARIRCVLRRIGKEGAAGIPNSGLIQINDIRIDTNKRQVFRGDERIRLTGMEFSLLELLVGRSGEPFSRGEILKEVWGYTPERHVDTRVVDVHISRLRSKLEDDPANPELILTARGTGYLFQRIVEAVAPESN